MVFQSDEEDYNALMAPQKLVIGDHNNIWMYMNLNGGRAFDNTKIVKRSLDGHHSCLYMQTNDTSVYSAVVVVLGRAMR